MKQTIEIPDLELYADNHYVNDRIRIYDKGDKILLTVAVDGAGNEFLIDKKILRRIL